jgi:hypothetical protein
MISREEYREPSGPQDVVNMLAVVFMIETGCSLKIRKSVFNGMVFSPCCDTKDDTAVSFWVADRLAGNENLVSSVVPTLSVGTELLERFSESKDEKMLNSLVKVVPKLNVAEEDA